MSEITTVEEQRNYYRSLIAAEKEVQRIAEEAISDYLIFLVKKIYDREYPHLSYIELHASFEDKQTIIRFTLMELEQANYEIVKYRIRQMACKFGEVIFLKGD